MTSAPNDIRDHILSNIKAFEVWEVELMIKEIDECVNLGMGCDVQDWNSFRDKLIKNI